MRADELLGQFLVDGDALARCQSEADRVIAAALAGHLVHRSSSEGDREKRPWRLDPIPLVLDGDEFDALAAAVRERLVAMEALLADLYGARRVVQEGWVPGEILSASTRYRWSVVGRPPPPRWLTSYAVDVVMLTDGTWRVVQDLADTPTGVGYALLDRSVMARVAAELIGPTGAGDLASISGFPSALRHALATTSAAASPRIVVFSGGVGAGAYVEHSSLARQLGFHLVEAPDLVVRRGRVWLRSLGGLEPVDVIYRRRSDAHLDPVEVDATSSAGIPGLALAAAEGGVVLANANGAGVLEDADLARHWPTAIEGLTGERLALPPLDGDIDSLARRPGFGDGQLRPAAVVVRLHAVAGPDGVTVMTGGNGRVLADDDDPRRPTARLAKDVWVLGADRAAPVLVAAALPQVDLASSVPTRAADAMYWLGRAAERAEAIARTARVVAERRQQDPSLLSYDSGRWARRMAAIVRVARCGPAEDDGGPVELDLELGDASRALGDQLRSLVAEAATVGEYLSSTTGRVLGDLAALQVALAAEGHAPLDALDAALEALAALAGLWNESTVRGPAWRFGDLGRRLERALVVLGLVDAGLTSEPLDAADVVDASVLEVLLAANESLVAYRRRHRSDIEPAAAAELLLLDLDNPRSFAASAHRLAEHVRAIGWMEGQDDVAELIEAIGHEHPLADVDRARQHVLALGASIARTWFATPVDPVVVHGALTT